MTKPTLRPDQIEDLAVLIGNKRHLLLSDPGTGKTPTVCVFMQYLWTHEKMGTCWSMPKSLMEKNREELLRFTDFSEDQIQIVDGRDGVRPGCAVYIMGFDRFALCWSDLPDYVGCHIVDELHMGFGGPTSKRTAQFIECGYEWPRFVWMTGTLVNGRYDSAWPAIHVIEPRYYGDHRTFYLYHADEDLWTGKLIGWRNHEKLQKIFARHSIRRTFEEVHGKESKIQFVEQVPMSPRQRELYAEFEDTAILELERFFVDGTEPGVGFIRARQIMEHPNRFPDLTNPGSYVDILPGEVPGKEAALLVHLEDHKRTGKPLIIFSSMIPQQIRVAEMVGALDMTYAVMNNETNMRQRAEIDREFQAGRIQVIICSPAVAGVGFNWQFWGDTEVDHIIFMSMSYQDTAFFQAYRRAMRQKRETPLRITIMEYRNSLDQRIFHLVAKKAAEANLIDPSRQRLEFKNHGENEPRYQDHVA